ncbi:MAG: ParA family protein [Oscillospiraceae bacterium]|nr:ParA family protein [Oscillospiraceae bacterium]
MTGKVTAIWGSPGSGKSTIATKVAYRLAEQGRETSLLFCDTTAPMLPCVCPPGEIERERSLGSVFAAAHATANLVSNNLTTLKRSDKLKMLGFLKRENAQSYPQCSERLAAELIDCLREIAEYVIIDCSGSYDALTLAALKSSDVTFRLVSGELKSVSYYSSQLPLLAELAPNLDAHLRVAANTRPLRFWEHINQTLSRTAFALPYSAEVERQCADGNLLSELKSKDGRLFARELDKIISEIL